MRLTDVQPVLDLSQRLLLRHRLQSLQETHTTALVLSEAQAESVLDLATYTGLQALVEIALKPDDLLAPARAREATARVVHTVNTWRNHPSLIGYLIDCPIAAEQLRMLGVERLRRALDRIIHEIHARDGRALVALKHRPSTIALATGAEDFLYAEVGGFSPAELAPFVIALHNLAMARPGPFYWMAVEGSHNFAALNFDDPKPSANAKRWDASEWASYYNLNLVAMDASVDFVVRAGPALVVAHNRKLIELMFERLPKDRFVPASPLDPARRGSYGCFAARSKEKTAEAYQHLRKENVVVSLREGNIRVSPYLYNTERDIDRLISVVTP